MKPAPKSKITRISTPSTSQPERLSTCGPSAPERLANSNPSILPGSAVSYQRVRLHSRGSTTSVSDPESGFTSAAVAGVMVASHLSAVSWEQPSFEAIAR